jgi:hypothetical protein
VNLFSSQIFIETGSIDPKLGTFWIGIANIIGCIFPILLIGSKDFLSNLDLGFGRKTLLVISFGTMAVCLVLITVGSFLKINSVRKYLEINLALVGAGDDLGLYHSLLARLWSNPLHIHHRYLL